MKQTPHDSIYKKFFSHPAMVEDLLRDFVPASIVEGLDFSSLRRVPHEHIGRGYIKRQNDLLWQVNLHGSPCYIILMLEFQRKNERWMAVRFLAYISLLWQSLLDGKKRLIQRKLPPVFPIVIYNGKNPWTAPCELASLLPPSPASLAEYQPTFKYYLIDELRLPGMEAGKSYGLAGHFFQLQRKGNLLEADNELKSLERILNNPELRELACTFAEWLCYAAYEAGLTEHQEKCETIQEVNAMLLESAPHWKDEYIAIGRQEGLATGRQEGLATGRREGLATGRQEGLVTGRREGLARGCDVLKNILGIMIKAKFGILAAEPARKLANMNDLDQLGDLAARINDIESIEKLVEEIDAMTEADSGNI